MGHGKATKFRIRSVPALYSTSSHLLPSVRPVRLSSAQSAHFTEGNTEVLQKPQRLRYKFISQSHILDSESLSHSLTGLLCSLPARGWGSVWGVLGAEMLGPRTERIKLSFITCEAKELLHAWITTLNHWGSAWTVNHAQGLVPALP